MTDASDAPDAALPGPNADPAPERRAAHLDVDAERARLERLEHDIETTERHAHEDLEPGGRGRVFADEGVKRQVEEFGDTDHPTGDGTGRNG